MDGALRLLDGEVVEQRAVWSDGLRAHAGPSGRELFGADLRQHALEVAHEDGLTQRAVDLHQPRPPLAGGHAPEPRIGERRGEVEKVTPEQKFRKLIEDDPSESGHYLELAEILKREDKVVTNMKNASAYPMFVLVLGLVSVTVIVTWILPGIMATMDMDPALMPLPTRMLLTMSDVVKAMFTTLFGGLATVALVIATVQLIRWIRTEGRLQWDAFRIRIPILGTVLKTIAVGRFARTLGALTAGGVTILDALAVVRDTLGNEVLAREIDAVAEEVKRGESLAAPLDRSGSFPPLLVQIVAVGEQTGKLDELLLSAADTFDDEADAAINRFMSIFPALLILLLALVVAFIVVATLLPMVSMDLGGLG